MSTARRRVLGLIGLPLLAIAVAVMVFTIGFTASPGTAHAADDVGQIAIDGPEIGNTLVPDTGIESAQLQPDSADATIGITGDQPIGLGPWSFEVTYDDDFVSTVDISPATTVFDDDVNSNIGTDHSAFVNDDTGSGLAVSPVEVVENPVTNGNVSGLGLTTAEGRGVLPVLYVAIFGSLIVLAMITATTMRQRKAFATGIFTAGHRTDFKNDDGTS